MVHIGVGKVALLTGITMLVASEAIAQARGATVTKVPDQVQG